jgi:Protein of unknown function (DUF3551)
MRQPASGGNAFAGLLRVGHALAQAPWFGRGGAALNCVATARLCWNRGCDRVFNHAGVAMVGDFAMKMTRLLAVLALAALAPIDASPAVAETNCRPWCVHYSRGGINCGFTSNEQCMWTAQGSDVCLVNPACLSQGSREGYDDRRRR